MEQEPRHQHDELMICKDCMYAGYDAGIKALRYSLGKAVENLEEQLGVKVSDLVSRQAVLDIIYSPESHA